MDPTKVLSTVQKCGPEGTKYKLGHVVMLIPEHRCDCAKMYAKLLLIETLELSQYNIFSSYFDVLSKYLWPHLNAYQDVGRKYRCFQDIAYLLSKH